MMLRRIECGVRHGHDGLGVGTETRGERIEVGREVGFLRGEVVPLAEVVAQVEQQMPVRAVLAAVKDAKELPIATMHGNRRRHRASSASAVCQTVEPHTGEK
jgi:hypothetical protein